MLRAFRIIAACLGVTFALAAVSQAQTADDLIAKNLAAKGGLETLKGTTTVKMTGRFTVQGKETPITTWAKRPNFVRREAALPPPAPMGTAPGQTLPPQMMISGSDGITAWMVLGTQAPQVLPDAGAQQDTEFDSVFIDYRQKGHRIEVAAKQTINGRPYDHLKVTRRDGSVQHYYLDPDTGLEAKVVSEVQRNGVRFPVETEMMDYRNVEGRMVPFRTRQTANGATAESIIDRIEFNVALPDSLFRMPGK